MKIALYGGSFNPIHNGHLLSAIFVKEKFNLDKLYFIPAHTPVHKDNSELEDGFHRLNMINLAIQGHSYFKSSDVELQRTGNSYTIDTVNHFIDLDFTSKIYLIIGDDLIDGLDTWDSIESLSEKIKFICLGRNNECINTKYSVEYTKNDIIQISSTNIRNRIKENKTIDYLVPESVRRYIENNSLYTGKLL